MSPRVLFVHNYPTRFVQIDLALLRERYIVDEWYQRKRPPNLLGLALAIKKSNLIFGWFASWHTFFPVLIARVLRRPTLLVVGGYDTANMPGIHYGSQQGGIRKLIAKSVMQWSTHLVTNSHYACSEVKEIGIDPGHVSVVYHGLPADNNTRHMRKERLAITVGNVDRGNLLRKGLEPFVLAGVRLPQLQFVVIGAWRDNAIDRLRSIAPSNVTFTGRLSDEKLNSYLARAQVYVQASRHEGFGLSVAEAMLQQCVPVVTRAGALPEVVGDTGIYVESSPDSIAGGVRRALDVDDEWGKRARDRILAEFPLARRQEQIYALIEKMMADG